MNGNQPAHKHNYQHKYWKSTIFSEDNPSDKTQNITLKITTRKGKGKSITEFQPKYKNEISNKERYLSQYWNRDDVIFPNNKPNIIKKGVININNSTRNHNSNGIDQSPITIDLTSKHLTTFQGNTQNATNNPMKRSKSVWQTRSKSGIVLEGNEKGNHKTKRIEALTSNIFNLKEKEKIVLKIKSPISKPKQKSIGKDNKKRSAMASVFDWKYSNTELSNKQHIRSKTVDPSARKRLELMSHFQDKPMPHPINNNLNPHIAQTDRKQTNKRPERNNNNAFASKNKEIEQYEINTKANFNNVDVGRIKQMFLSQGIHIYNYQENGSSVNGFQSGKISFNIRKDNNDASINTKMQQITFKIQALGLGMSQIVKDTHIKKLRNQTPGRELVINAKIRKTIGEEKLKNTKIQSSIQYKNYDAYKNKKKV